MTFPLRPDPSAGREDAAKRAAVNRARVAFARGGAGVVMASRVVVPHRQGPW
ncbi:hypothetical protein ACQP25_16425 [Microtetraspora malaysiensis]|uniref:hypothetical protein n=1 Tax=Microtetraspora malaysiensis TaxID=161358 RepID=UPI003D8A7705